MRNFIFLLLVSIASLATHAQQPNGPWQKPWAQPKQQFSPEQFVKDMKAFVINEAKLTQEEADKFFPMWFEMYGKTQAVQKKIRELQREAHKSQAQMTESQYESTINEICKLEVKDKQIEQAYYKKFHSVLSWEKIYKVRNAINAYHMRAISMFQRKQPFPIFNGK